MLQRVKLKTKQLKNPIKHNTNISKNIDSSSTEKAILAGRVTEALELTFVRTARDNLTCNALGAVLGGHLYDLSYLGL